MTEHSKNLSLECLELMLRPIIWFCLQRTLGVQDLLESAKRVFVELAAKEIKRREKRFSFSRLSAMTGLQRKDAARIYRDDERKETTVLYTTRVIGLWRKDRRFTTSSGKPRVLQHRGEENEFSALVAAAGSDLHPGAVLYDLERLGSIRVTRNGVKLVSRAYRPDRASPDVYRIMSRDAEDLMSAVLANALSQSKDLPNFHVRISYDRIPAENLPKIRAWLFKQCSALQYRVVAFLSKHDVELNRDVKKQGDSAVTLGIFTRT